MKKFNAYQIKMFMAWIMVLDHLDHIPNFISADLSLVFHVVTRCVGVWFAYMVAEGFYYTRDKLRYNLRIAGWAFFMWGGNLALEMLYQSKEISIENNIFATLALSVLALNVLGGFKKSRAVMRIVKVIGLVGVIALGILIGAEGLVPVLPFVLISYYLRDRIKVRNVVMLLFALFLFVTSYVPYDDFASTIQMLAYNSDFMFITVIPFIYLYNGERGPKGRFAKYFFYVFYPAHLWIIATIAYFVK